MAFRPSKRSHHPQEEAHLNLAPFLDFLMMVVTFLVATVALVHTSIINLSLPQATEEAAVQAPPPKPNQPVLNLTVGITKSGLQIGGTGGMDRLIPRLASGEYDTVSLNARLVEIKHAFPTDENVILLADPDLPYEDLIHVMDACREYTPPGGRKSALFPNVSIGEVVK